jgi:hypothetical protein
VCVADTLKLPYKTASFDAVISIAVVHHLSNQARRVAAVQVFKGEGKGRGHLFVFAGGWVGGFFFPPGEGGQEGGGGYSQR